VVVAIAVGVLAGLYPAFFISSFSAKRVLSGDLQRGSTAIWVRKSLLTFQASLAIGLIVGSVTLLQQLSHLQNLPLGYQTNQRLVISEVPVGNIFTQQPSAVFNKLSAINGVQHIGVIDTQLTRSINNTLKPTWPNGEQSNGITPIIGSGYEVVKSLGLELLAGRDFSAQYAGDWANRANGVTHVGVIITETVAKQAGFNNMADIIGKTIKDTGRNVEMRVVGVVADVKVGNAHNSNSDIMFLLGFSYFNPTSEVVLTVNPQNVLSIRQQAAEILAQHANVFEPKINLLSDSYKAVLRGDERVSQVVLIFTGLAVFLTCLGTFGLASFAAARRQKEVAVRKVLGASRISIVNILAKEFLVLVGVSIAIAYPVTYLLVGDWLANFNDRIDQAVWVYGIAAVVVAGITWVTVASLAFKAASTRPSLILRYE
jgi:putative ABC transport system permease protein